MMFWAVTGKMISVLSSFKLRKAKFDILKSGFYLSYIGLKLGIKSEENVGVICILVEAM